MACGQMKHKVESFDYLRFAIAVGAIIKVKFGDFSELFFFDVRDHMFCVSLKIVALLGLRRGRLELWELDFPIAEFAVSSEAVFD